MPSRFVRCLSERTQQQTKAESGFGLRVASGGGGRQQPEGSVRSDKWSLSSEGRGNGSPVDCQTVNTHDVLTETRLWRRNRNHRRITND